MIERTRQVKEAKQRSRRIDRLYETLSDRVDYVEEYDLQDEVLDWMDRAGELPASTVLDHVAGVLSRIETQYQMYRKHNSGEDDFPDRCEGCEHYGVACPLLSYESNQIELERMQEELVGEPEETVKQRLRQMAGRVGCHVIVEEIETWETEYADLLQEGREYRRQIIHLLRPADRSETANEEIAEATDGGGR